MTLRARDGAVALTPAKDPVDAIGLTESDGVVRRAQHGDVDAFESIYRTHAAAVYALCRRMTSDDRQARELTQDAFVRVWERLTQFRGQSALGTWIHRLAVNVVLEHVRSRKRSDARSGADAYDLPDGRRVDAQIHARLDVDAAIARLPTGARTVFVLHDIEGYSHDEIAQMTGMAAGTARAQLWRARRALMRLLDL
jgi:RNA polymerase sigma-70 factor, ECF subfamily